MVSGSIHIEKAASMAFTDKREIVQVHEVNSHSLLLRVEGSEAGSRPYMLAAHLDVVPPGDTDRSHV